MNEIKKVSEEFMNQLLASCDKNFKYQPLGKFYLPGTELRISKIPGFVACDNSTGDAFTEFFQLEEQALIWLSVETLTVTQANFRFIPTIDVNGNIIEVTKYEYL